MKKHTYLGLLLLLVLSLTACGNQVNETDMPPASDTKEPAVLEPAPELEPEPEPEPEPPIPFTDVPEDASYYDTVVWAYESGIVSDGSTFEPDSTCTRAQVIMFLWRAMGSPEPWIMENPFSDASPDDWYYKPALWAYQHNIATSTTVNPSNPCTNAEALTFLWRAEREPDKLNTLAASGTYYGQPVAWADKNGLFAGTEFDSAAPCSRADLIAYLYWAVEQWTPSEEQQRIQTEYDKILYSSSTTPDYAEYVDVDGDGNVELLTLDHRYNNSQYELAITVYADMGGHIEKSCEGIFQMVENGQNTPADTFLTDGGLFSLYSSDGQLYLCQTRSFYMYGKHDDLYDFYKIEKEAVTFCEQRDIWTYFDRETGEERSGDTGTSLNYTKQKDILRSEGRNRFEYSVLDNGIAPSREENNVAMSRYWTDYWAASDPMYAAVLEGDFSYFAGNYKDDNDWTGDITLSNDGVVTGTGGYHVGLAPISVTVSENGAIKCTVRLIERNEDDDIYYYPEYYIIYPAGINDNNPDYQSDPNRVRIEYWWPSQGVDMSMYSKVS